MKRFREKTVEGQDGVSLIRLTAPPVGRDQASPYRREWIGRTMVTTTAALTPHRTRSGGKRRRTSVTVAVRWLWLMMETISSPPRDDKGEKGGDGDAAMGSTM